MKLRNCLLLGLLILFTEALWAYGTGYSSYPLKLRRKLVTAEMAGVMSNGGGLGMQARYTHKALRNMTVDAGIGMGGGERSGRFFIGSDIEILPDYVRQPRVSFKAKFENAKEFGARRNILSVAPTVSKGFSFWGHEGYPFISLPMGISMDQRGGTYQTISALSMGITGKLPFKGYEAFKGNFETTFNLKGSQTGVLLGISYPLR